MGRRGGAGKAELVQGDEVHGGGPPGSRDEPAAVGGREDEGLQGEHHPLFQLRRQAPPRLHRIRRSGILAD